MAGLCDTRLLPVPKPLLKCFKVITFLVLKDDQAIWQTKVSDWFSVGVFQGSSGVEGQCSVQESDYDNTHNHSEPEDYGYSPYLFDL